MQYKLSGLWNTWSMCLYICKYSVKVKVGQYTPARSSCITNTKHHINTAYVNVEDLVSTHMNVIKISCCQLHVIKDVSYLKIICPEH